MPDTTFPSIDFSAERHAHLMKEAARTLKSVIRESEVPAAKSAARIMMNDAVDNDAGIDNIPVYRQTVEASNMLYEALKSFE